MVNQNKKQKKKKIEQINHKEKPLKLEKITYSEKEIKEIKHVRNKKIIVFIGMGSCGIASGAQETLKKIMELKTSLSLDFEIEKVGCMGACYCEPIVDIKLPGKSRLSFHSVKKDIVEKIFSQFIIDKEIPKDYLFGQYPAEDGDEEFDPSQVHYIHEHPFFKDQYKFVLSRCGIINPERIEEYIAYDNGYKALIKVLKKNDPLWIIEEIKKSGLRGRGGAGFPTGLKWEYAFKSRSPDGQKYVIMNADEGDPGAFMNRAELESDPFSAIEGMTIIGYAINATKGYIYCRAEYPLVIKRLQHAIDISRKYGLLGENILNSGFNFDIEIKQGAGAFVCGEETALIKSIEGCRGQAELKPPFPTTSGLFGRPTVINNVETIHQIPKIINIGAENFAKIGNESSKGTKVFCLTGKINRTGLVEVPLGTSLKKILEIGGGISEGGTFKAVQCGGPSGGCVPKQFLDLPIDYESLKKVGAMMGSGGMVVMDNETCMVATAKYFMEFIQDESCGKCIPCREGTRRLLETLELLITQPKSDKDVVERMKKIMSLEKLAHVIRDTALCGLGISAPNPVLSTLRYFKDEYDAHLYENRCPAKQCLGLVTFKIDNSKCKGCGLCKLNCPVDAIVGEIKEAHYIIAEKCIHCGLCYENCNFNAIIKI